MPVVIYEKKGKIAYITLNRPEKLNALDPELVEALAKTWVDFRDDDKLWVAIITGAGRAFSAGGDVPSIGRSGFNALRCTPGNFEVWKPIIAALNGYVLGAAGMLLALGADLRIATEDVELGFPEPRWGIVSVFSALLPRYIPRAIASELLLVGDRISAQRAYEVGLVNRVVPSEKLLSSATELAERICENGPLAVRALKEIVERTQGMDYFGTMALAQKLFTQVRKTEDFEEGVKAFMAKRKPKWQVR